MTKLQEGVISIVVALSLGAAFVTLMLEIDQLQKRVEQLREYIQENELPVPAWKHD